MFVLRPMLLVFVVALFALLTYKIFLIGSFLLTMDSYARWKEYERLKRTHSVSLKRKLEKSWCGRGVLKSYDPSYVDPSPYNIFPKGSPQVFLKKNFWVSALGLGHWCYVIGKLKIFWRK